MKTSRKQKVRYFLHSIILSALLTSTALEKTPESPLDCKEIQPVHSKGDQSWVFFGRNDAKTETPILWPPHAKTCCCCCCCCYSVASVVSDSVRPRRWQPTRLLHPWDANSWLTGKDSDAGRDWGQEEKGTTEDEMAGRHHRLDGREFEWTPGVGDGQGGLACCIHGVAKSRTQLSDWTELWNWY